MNIALWIIAGLLAAAFLASGAMRLFQPKEKLVRLRVEFLEGFGVGSIKAIGGPPKSIDGRFPVSWAQLSVPGRSIMTLLCM